MSLDDQTIIDRFASRRELIIGEIRELVDVDSPSNDRERSREVVDRLAAKFADAYPGIQIDRIETEVGDHIIINAFVDDAPHVFLLGHTDTVHPVGSRELNPTRIENGRLYGCGVFDMKSNIVLMLESLRYFRDTGRRPSRPIRILLSCDEEVGSHTGREFVEREAAGAKHCLVFEPSANGDCKTGRKGTGMYMVTAHGIPAHAGLEPEKGASAVLEIARQIETLHSMNDLSIGTTVNVCTVSGGTTTNVIPEHAEASVDVRFSSMSEAERIDLAIRSLSPQDQRVELDITGGINRPPMERTDAVVSLYKAGHDISASIGVEFGEVQVGGASDGNFVGALGVPVLDGLGIKGNGAHTLGEYIEVDDVVPRAALMTVLLERL